MKMNTPRHHGKRLCAVAWLLSILLLASCGASGSSAPADSAPANSAAASGTPAGSAPTGSTPADSALASSALASSAPASPNAGETVEITDLLGASEARIIEVFGPKQSDWTYGQSTVLIDGPKGAVLIESAAPNFTAAGLPIGATAAQMAQQLGQPVFCSYAVSLRGDQSLQDIYRYALHDRDIYLDITINNKNGLVTRLSASTDLQASIEGYRQSGLAGDWMIAESGEYVKFFEDGYLALYDANQNECAHGAYMPYQNELSLAVLFPDANARMLGKGTYTVANGKVAVQLDTALQNNTDGSAMVRTDGGTTLSWTLVPLSGGQTEPQTTPQSDASRQERADQFKALLAEAHPNAYITVANLNFDVSYDQKKFPSIVCSVVTDIGSSLQYALADDGVIYIIDTDDTQNILEHGSTWKRVN